MSHSVFLAVGYSVACLLWWVMDRFVPLWRDPEHPTFRKPWLDVIRVLLGVIGTIALGQLWSAGIRLEAEGALGSIAESINQIVIFAPIIAIPILRRDGWASVWVRWDRMPLRHEYQRP